MKACKNDGSFIRVAYGLRAMRYAAATRLRATMFAAIIYVSFNSFA